MPPLTHIFPGPACDVSFCRVLRQEVVEVAIKPGWKEGTRVIFEGKGDRLPGRPPQDVVFVIKQVPHPRFTRQGDDLVTEVSVTQRTLT